MQFGFSGLHLVGLTPQTENIYLKPWADAKCLSVCQGELCAVLQHRIAVYSDQYPDPYQRFAEVEGHVLPEVMLGARAGIIELLTENVPSFYTHTPTNASLPRKPIRCHMSQDLIGSKRFFKSRFFMRKNVEKNAKKLSEKNL